MFHVIKMYSTLLQYCSFLNNEIYGAHMLWPYQATRCTSGTRRVNGGSNKRGYLGIWLRFMGL